MALENDQNVEAIKLQSQDVEAGNAANTPKKLPLEAMALLLCTNKVSSIEKQTKDELQQLRQRQTQVKFLHQLLKAVNKATSDKGALDASQYPDLMDLMSKAQEMGTDLDPSKKSYSKDERDRLVENIRMTCDDLNIENEMQLQAISRLTNERYEAYQMARSIMKPLHEDKINKARSISGR